MNIYYYLSINIGDIWNYRKNVLSVIEYCYSLYLIVISSTTVDYIHLESFVQMSFGLILMFFKSQNTSNSDPDESSVGIVYQ